MQTQHTTTSGAALERAANGERSSGGDGAVRLARGLGWFSVGLGLTQLLAPRALARMIGLEDDKQTRNTLYAIGLRELASGVGLLRQPTSARFAWSRVTGDVMDLALLGAAARASEHDGRRTAGAVAAVLGVTALDVVAATRLSRAGGAATGRRGGGRHVVKVVTVNRSPAEAYRLFRNFEHLPRFMAHVDEVRVLDARRSHWVVRAPAGTHVEWDAEIVEEVPNERIAWRSIEGADVEHAGRVEFTPAPGGRGTEVRLDLCYRAPGGRLGAGIAKLFGEEPGAQAEGDLRRFKQVLETGEVMHSDASIFRGLHPGRPPSDDELGEVSLSGTEGRL